MDTAIQQRPMLTLRETAERLNVSEKTIRRLVGNGELVASRVGSQLRIDADHLEAWLAQRSGQAVPNMAAARVE